MSKMRQQGCPQKFNAFLSGAAVDVSAFQSGAYRCRACHRKFVARLKGKDDDDSAFAASI